MEIGTAAPTAEQLQRVNHYFVGTHSVGSYYSAAQYEQDVLSLVAELEGRHQSLLLSGGSMLYIDAVCHGIDDIPTVDDLTRRELAARLKNEGLDQLREELRIIDPPTYNKIDLKNPRRIVHALEIYYCTGKPYSTFLRHTSKHRPFDIIKIGLRRERTDLFHRINQRVDAMMNQGLYDEALSLYPYRTYNALQTVGYNELFRVIAGE
jgi:tRNA dimethylallyltransferase